MTSDTEKPPATNSRKRKRSEPKKEQGAHLPSYLDFFNRDSEDGVTVNISATVEINDNDKSRSEDEPRKIEENILSLAMGDCRRILKRHKLKVTLLNIGLDADSRRTAQADSNHGKNAVKQLTIQPLTTFKQLRARYGISRRLAENIQEQGYFEPTEVQMGSLPVLLGSNEDRGFYQSAEKSQGESHKSNVDLLTIAPTGSGKTLAFLIHVFHGLLTELAVSKKASGLTEREHKVRALIVVPTHELADQIANEGRKLAMGTGLKVAVMRKGMRLTVDERGADNDCTKKEFADEDQNDRHQPLVKVDVLVSTPLVLVHAISSTSNADPTPVPEIRYLVLDEADVLLDPLFRSQTLGIWNACIHPSLQTSLWSATIGASIETLAQTFILDRRRNLKLSTPETTSHHIIRLVVGLKDSAIPNVSHRLIYAATEQGKLLALRQLLHPTSSSSDGSLCIQPPFLVFTQTIPRAIALHAELRYDISPEAGGSTRLAILHSDLSSAARSSIMANFRKGEIWVLITTDLLSRGVDFRGVNGVVNYDMPTTGVSYVHRAGRTGRQGRQGGIAVTLYTKEDIPYVRNVANVIAASEKVHSRKSSTISTAIKNNGSSNTPISNWLLDFLPAVSKKTKKELKLRGVASRRVLDHASSSSADAGKKEKSKVNRISTKSGYQRQLENRKRAMTRSTSKNLHVDANARGNEESDDDGEWGGIAD